MSRNIRLEDLPPRLREQAERQLAARASEPPQPRTSNSEPRISSPRKPNKTEAEYNIMRLGGKGMYEAITLRLPGGSRYTPDWVTVEGGTVTLHEVKGSYRLNSHGRAATAFRECVVAFPCFRFVWAVRRNGAYEISKYQSITGGAHT